MYSLIHLCNGPFGRQDPASGSASGAEPPKSEHPAHRLGSLVPLIGCFQKLGGVLFFSRRGGSLS